MSNSCFLVTEIDKVRLYDINTYKKVGEIQLKLFAPEGREPFQAIGIEKSKDENWLAIVTGKNLVKGQ